MLRGVAGSFGVLQGAAGCCGVPQGARSTPGLTLPTFPALLHKIKQWLRVLKHTEHGAPVPQRRFPSPKSRHLQPMLDLGPVPEQPGTSVVPACCSAGTGSERPRWFLRGPRLALGVAAPQKLSRGSPGLSGGRACPGGCACPGGSVRLTPLQGQWHGAGAPSGALKLDPGVGRCLLCPNLGWARHKGAEGVQKHSPLQIGPGAWTPAKPSRADHLGARPKRAPIRKRPERADGGSHFPKLEAGTNP